MVSNFINMNDYICIRDIVRVIIWKLSLIFASEELKRSHRECLNLKVVKAVFIAGDGD